MQIDQYETKLAYSIREARHASSLGRTTLFAHMKAGRLQTVKVGGRTLIPAASSKALLSPVTETNGLQAEGPEVRHGTR